MLPPQVTPNTAAAWTATAAITVLCHIIVIGEDPIATIERSSAIELFFWVNNDTAKELGIG